MFTSFAVALPKTNMFTPEHMVAKGNETPFFLDKWPIFSGGCCWLHGGVLTPWKFNIVSEIGPFFKRKFIFQPSCFRGKCFPCFGSCRAIRLPCHFLPLRKPKGDIVHFMASWLGFFAVITSIIKKASIQLMVNGGLGPGDLGF